MSQLQLPIWVLLELGFNTFYSKETKFILTASIDDILWIEFRPTVENPWFYCKNYNDGETISQSMDITSEVQLRGVLTAFKIDKG